MLRRRNVLIGIVDPARRRLPRQKIQRAVLAMIAARMCYIIPLTFGQHRLPLRSHASRLWQQGHAVLSGASVMHAWKMRRQRSPIGLPLLLRSFVYWRRLVLFGILCSHRRFEILDRQLQLLRVKTFGLAAELGTPKLLQQMAKPIVLLHHALAFCKRCIALGGELSHQFSQAIEIIGESIDRHDRIESDSRTAVLFSNPPDSRSRSTHDVAVGRTISRACNLDQSIPSTSAANCADVSRITPLVTGGHLNAPLSSRVHNSTSPAPSQATIFTRSARFERKT